MISKYLHYLLDLFFNQTHANILKTKKIDKKNIGKISKIELVEVFP